MYVVGGVQWSWSFSVSLVCFSPYMRYPWPLSRGGAGGWPDARCHPDWAVWGSAHNPEGKNKQQSVNILHQ